MPFWVVEERDKFFSRRRREEGCESEDERHSFFSCSERETRGVRVKMGGIHFFLVASERQGL